MKKYLFSDVDACNMCGLSGPKHLKTLGLRLNGSQGLFPRAKRGVAVSVCKCVGCRLVFPNPMPVPELLSDHYGVPVENYWNESYFHLRDDYFKREMETARQLTGILSGGRALDIGAGVGKAMTALKRDGWDVYGIEPSLPFYEKALSRMDIDPQRLRHNSLEDAEFDANSFDFVTFGAVLEHLYDPAFAIKRALGWLKPGGVIQIEVPSSDYLWHKILNSWYRISGSSFVSNLSPMHSPYHIFEFSLRSFEELGKKEGFSVNKYWYEVASGRFIPRSLYWFLRPLMQRTNTGMQLTLYLQKQL